MTATATVDDRLAELGITLPDPPPPLATFEPVVRSGVLVYTSGQIAERDGQLVSSGVLGADVDVAAGQEAARTCAVNVLAQLRAATGSLDSIARLLKVTVFVASAPGFTGQSQVADGASRLFHDVLGAAGRHARSAVGVAALPLGTPVEIEVVAELRPEAAR
jgi:enamine deaminase RidA (YjgF/YER057c/UK114 family)